MRQQCKDSLAEVNRYPILPGLVIMLVLIIPAVFAELIAPHGPLDGDLDRRLLPPAWATEVTTVKILVERVTPGRGGDPDHGDRCGVGA